MNLNDIAVHRLYHQRLSHPSVATPQEMVAWFGAVQSQDYAGGKWAVAQRMIGATDDTIEAAFNRGEILRTHLLRPTWHFVTPADIRWMLRLTAPHVNRAVASYYRQNELDDSYFARCNRLFEKALAGGNHLTKTALGQLLADAGIVADKGRLGFILMRAELDGVLCSGARQGKNQTFALLEEWVAPAPELSREESLAALALRYFTSHGPATLKDYRWWSGLPMGDAKAGIAMVKGELAEITIGEQHYWFREATIPPGEPTPTIYLLPNYDEYLVAYTDRTASYNPESRPSGDTLENVIFAHTIVLDGQVVGTWKTNAPKQTLTPTFFRTLSALEMEAYESAVEKYRNYL